MVYESGVKIPFLVARTVQFGVIVSMHIYVLYVGQQLAMFVCATSHQLRDLNPSRFAAVLMMCPLHLEFEPLHLDKDGRFR
jgi:hypothetical protein